MTLLLGARWIVRNISETSDLLECSFTTLLGWQKVVWKKGNFQLMMVVWREMCWWGWSIMGRVVPLIVHIMLANKAIIILITTKVCKILSLNALHDKTLTFAYTRCNPCQLRISRWECNTNTISSKQTMFWWDRVINILGCCWQCDDVGDIFLT